MPPLAGRRDESRRGTLKRAPQRSGPNSPAFNLMVVRWAMATHAVIGADLEIGDPRGCGREGAVSFVGDGEYTSA